MDSYRLESEQEEKEAWLFNQMVQFLFGSALRSILPTLILILVFSFLSRNQMAESLPGQVWLVLALLLNTIRLVHYGLYRWHGDLLSSYKWLLGYRILVFLSGVAYAAIPFIFFNAVPLPMLVFQMFIMVALPAASVGTHAVDLTTFRLFMLTIALPDLLFLILLDESVFQVVGIQIGLFVFVMDRSGVQSSRSFRKNFELTYSMKYRATHDPLVGLYNRIELENQFELHVSRSQRSIATMFVDLDDFKPLNDTLGHQAGDVALQQVADVIKHSIRSDDVAARLGGDEFVILLNLDHQHEAIHIAQTILSGIAKLHFEGYSQGLSASIGICFHSQSNVGFSKLMRIADIACYESKRLGKNQISLKQYKDQE